MTCGSRLRRSSAVVTPQPRDLVGRSEGVLHHHSPVEHLLVLKILRVEEVTTGLERCTADERVPLRELIPERKPHRLTNGFLIYGDNLAKIHQAVGDLIGVRPGETVLTGECRYDFADNLCADDRRILDDCPCSF